MRVKKQINSLMMSEKVIFSIKTSLIYSSVGYSGAVLGKFPGEILSVGKLSVQKIAS